MTLPDERYRAIKMAETLLKDLCDRSKTPRVPKAVRARASSCLRHYPNQWDLDRLAAAAPEVIQQRMDDLHKMILSHEIAKKSLTDEDK
jgi:hypothetical protein